MTTVVFVHGLMGGSAQWKGQSRAFSSFDFVALDLPGFGLNADMDPLDSIADFAIWALNELIKRGVEQFHLVGHSMGGMVAQEMVARAPERVDRLVLYGTGPTGVLPGRFETIATSKDRARADGSTVTAKRIAATWFLERENARAYESCAAIAQLCRVEAILAGLDAMSSWNGIDHLPQIGTKALIVWGDHDRTYPWHQTEKLWRSIQGANLAVLPGCAHASHLEKQSLFNSILEDFFAD
jgi:pimeloyl-ACP methyl ester carboxylesterase